MPAADPPAPRQSAVWAALGAVASGSLKRTLPAWREGACFHGLERLDVVLVHCNKIVPGGAIRALNAQIPQGD